jgi:hypothetical protein
VGLVRARDGRRRADRTNFADASDFVGWYMHTNLRRNGVPLHDAYRQYLAYHEGHGGYARGTYNGKSWLPPVARDVQNWANRYEAHCAPAPAEARSGVAASAARLYAPRAIP